jgi:hypothetical protein
MNTNLTRRHAVRGLAASLAGAIAVLPNAGAKAAPSDLHVIEKLIARWRELDTATNAQSKLDTAYYEELEATAPPVPDLLKKAILQRDGCPVDPFTQYRDHGYLLEALERHVKWSRRAIKRYGSRTDDQGKDIIAHNTLVLQQASQRLRLRKSYDKARDLHWAEYERREEAWSLMVDKTDEALKALIALPVTSPQALKRKTTFLGSLRWFQECHDYETVHKVALAFAADIQRVAFGEV